MITLEKRAETLMGRSKHRHSYGAWFPFGIDTGIPENTNLAVRIQKDLQFNNMTAPKVTKMV